MNRKAVALLSGGLDSTLAICIVKEQGIEIEAVNFQTMFNCCKDDSARVAYGLGVRLTHLKVGDDYLKIVEKPKYGWGRGINPCVDCRGYMFEIAKKFMEKIGASFLITGEVLDQRPMSQKMRDFKVIEEETGLAGFILRPLSAKLLPVTEPERLGIVDRSRLYGIQGRSREHLLELAAKYGIENPPSPSSGCALTSPGFAKKVKDVFEYRPDYERWEFEILKIGRHFRLSPSLKIVVARNQEENAYLEMLEQTGTALARPVNFTGPNALLIGAYDFRDLEKVGMLMLRYGQRPLPERGEIEVRTQKQTQTLEVPRPAEESEVDAVRIV